MIGRNSNGLRLFPFLENPNATFSPFTFPLAKPKYVITRKKKEPQISGPLRFLPVCIRLRP